MKVHPDAELYPMMPDEELEALAADIKMNGLRFPIAVAMVDGERTLIDGRNRLRACELAGVTPTFIELNGQDPKAYILAANVLRRHMPKGQKAMAVAFQYPEGEKTGRGAKSAGRIAQISVAISDERVRQARQVLRYSRDLALTVLRGDVTLDAALERMKEEEAGRQSDEGRLQRLRIAAPDLAEQVAEGRLSLDEAFGAWRVREETEQRDRAAVLHQFAQLHTMLGGRDQQTIAHTITLLPNYDGLGALKESRAYLDALIRAFEEVRHGKG